MTEERRELVHVSYFQLARALGLEDGKILRVTTDAYSDHIYVHVEGGPHAKPMYHGGVPEGRTFVAPVPESTDKPKPAKKATKKAVAKKAAPRRKKS